VRRSRRGRRGRLFVVDRELCVEYRVEFVAQGFLPREWVTEFHAARDDREPQAVAT
jgi:hypothetical protein